MTNTGLFRKKVDNRGVKLKFLAETLGISPFALQKKIENRNEFKASEIDKLGQLLDLSRDEVDAIFFDRNVELQSTNKAEA